MVEFKGMTWSHNRDYKSLIAASEIFQQIQDIKISWEKCSLQAFSKQPLHELAYIYDFRSLTTLMQEKQFLKISSTIKVLINR